MVSLNSNPDMQTFFKLTVDMMVEDGDSKHWVAVGHNQGIMNESCGENLPFLRAGDGKNTLRLGKLWGWLRGFPAVVKAFLVWKPQVILFLGVHIDNLPFYLLGWLRRSKMIFVIHDWTPHPGWKATLIDVNNWLIAKIIGDACIFYSKLGCSEWKGRGAKFSAVLGGFPQRVAKAKVGEKCLLFFGRIEHYKGLYHLCSLAAYMERELPDWKIIVAGAGRDPALPELMHRPNVEVINRFIEDLETDDLYRRASFTILPYDSATQSGVALLSFAFGTPVIAHAVGALPEYLQGPAGTLVEPGDCEAILRFLKAADPHFIQTCSEDAIRRYESQYSPEAFKQAQRQVVREAMDYLVTRAS